MQDTHPTISRFYERFQSFHALRTTGKYTNSVGLTMTV